MSSHSLTLIISSFLLVVLVTVIPMIWSRKFLAGSSNNETNEPEDPEEENPSFIPELAETEPPLLTYFDVKVIQNIFSDYGDCPECTKMYEEMEAFYFYDAEQIEYLDDLITWLEEEKKFAEQLRQRIIPHFNIRHPQDDKAWSLFRRLSELLDQGLDQRQELAVAREKVKNTGAEIHEAALETNRISV